MISIAVGDVFSVHTDPRKLLIAEVLGVAAERNLLQVRLYPIEVNRAAWEEDWRLDHTHEGLEKQLYRWVASSPPCATTGSMTGRSSSASPNVTEVSSLASNFARQAAAAAKMPLLVPPAAQPLGSGPLADSYVMDVDGREIELRLMAWRTPEQAAAKAYTEMEIPPGYNNYYADGMMAHNQGELPDKAPFHQLNQKVTLAWLRGWSKAREVYLEHKQKASKSSVSDA